MTVLKIIKVPLPEPIPDIKPNFGKLDFKTLNLDLIENKKKLKPNLPLIPIKMNPTPVVKSTNPEVSKKIKEEFELSGDEKISKENKENKESKENVSKETKEKEKFKEILDESEDEKKDNPQGSSSSSSKEQDSSSKEPSSKEHENNQESKSSDTQEEKEPEAEPTSEDAEPEVPSVSQEQLEEEEKEELLVKFRILKKANPTHEFPTYSEHTDLQTLKRLYKNTVRLINLDENVKSYRQWLMGGFLAIELLGGYIGIDLKGFAKIQMKKKEKYDALLIELGEKSYTSFATNWPVEVRIMGLILFDAAIFWLGKIVAEKSGTQMVDMLNTFFGLDIPVEKKETNSQPQMRGPSMKASDIKNMNKKNA